MCSQTWANKDTANVTASSFTPAFVSTAVHKLWVWQKQYQISEVSLPSNQTEIYVVKPTEKKEIKSSKMTKSQFLVGSLVTELFIPWRTTQTICFHFLDILSV